MNTSFLRPALAAIACAAAFSFVTPSFAEVVNFKAHMDAKDEVPPNQSKGKGDVTATYDTASKKLSYKGTYSDLSGPATAAHFHGPASAGKNAGVVIPIFAGTAAGSARPAPRRSTASSRPGWRRNGASRSSTRNSGDLPTRLPGLMNRHMPLGAAEHGLRPRTHGLTVAVVAAKLEHEQPDRRRQVAVLALGVDAADQLRQVDAEIVRD